MKNLNPDIKVELNKVQVLFKYLKAKYEVFYIKKKGVIYMFQYRIGSVDALGHFKKSNTDDGYQVWRSFCTQIINRYRGTPPIEDANFK